MSTLRATITELASSFAAGVLSAIRGASLEEILSETKRGGGAGGAGAGSAGGRRGPGRPRAVVAEAAEEESAGRGRGRAARGRRGRLGRRSPTDIAAIVDSIVSLLASSPNGLRAEEIRQKLGLDANELPRPIKDALDAKRISKQGQKRATTYFARGAGGGAKASGGGAKAGKKAGKKAGRPAAKKAVAAKRGGGKRGKGSAKAAAAAAQTNGTPAEATA
jgi:hypothetical protein